MRLPAATASILAIGLVAAACGGDEATPEPTEEPTTAAAATEAAEQPAGEPTEAPADADSTEGPAEDEAAAEPEFAKKAAITSEDDPATAFAMTSGRYRMQWQTDGCEQVDLLVTQTDGDFTYPHPSKSSFASATINDMPEGTYTIEQLDPTCEEWSVRIDWMTN
jgi:hypothetical protein